MWVQNKMGTRPETALAQRSRRCFQNFWVTTGRLNFLWSNVRNIDLIGTKMSQEKKLPEMVETKVARNKSIYLVLEAFLN